MLNFNKEGEIMLVRLASPFIRYLYDAFHEHDRYFNKLISFYKALPLHMRQDIRVRLPGLSARSDTSDRARWRSNDSKIKIDNFSRPFAKAVSDSRIVVFAYFSTGVLECMSQNILIIFFWKNPLETIKPDVRSLFKDLINTKILHESSDQAAKHLISLNQDIDAWWNSYDVKTCRDEFTEHFAKHSQNPDKDLVDLLSFVENN